MRFRAFPQQQPAQHLLRPSPMHYICATVAQAFTLRRCAPVTLFVYQARRRFERACRTGAGAITPSTQPRQWSNSPLVLVGAFHFARNCFAWDFRRFVNKLDAWLHFLLAKVRNLVRTFVEDSFHFPHDCILLTIVIRTRTYYETSWSDDWFKSRDLKTQLPCVRDSSPRR
jgi:hypothetical protein